MECNSIDAILPERRRKSDQSRSLTAPYCQAVLRLRLRKVAAPLDVVHVY